MTPTDRPDGSEKFALGRISSRRGRITLTYVLALLENLFELMYPLAIGMAINGLIGGETAALMPLVLIWLSHIAVGGFRQVYDTWLFSHLYADIATDIAVLQRGAGKDVSEVAARVEMTRAFMDFFELEVPSLVAAAAGLFGGVALLFLYDPVSGAIMAALLGPVGLINAFMGVRALRYNRALNNQLEQQVDIIATGLRRRNRLHFGRLAQWRVRLSNADAGSWMLSEILGLGATIFVLFRMASEPGVLPGDLFASLAYVLRILDGIDEVPGVVQQVGRLFDIRRRIRSEGGQAR